MSKKISVRNLYKIFGQDPDNAVERLNGGDNKDELLRETGMVVGVDDCSFDVDEGEIFVVMGLSGSGKSTLVRMLNLLIPPSAGEIDIDGDEITSLNAKDLREVRLKKIAMVFQHFALFPHRTVVENAAYGLRVQGLPRAERRERGLEALDRVGLKAWADHRTGTLSGGMQQRVGLARGLAVNPEILLMDEPFSALDPLIRRDMQDELLQLQRELKKTIVFITHDLHEALILGDKIAIMKEGRFVQVGTAEEIVSNPADDYVAAFTQDIDRARVFSASNVMDPPQALDLARDDADSARKRMHESGRNALHVLDNDRVAGIVTYRALAEESGGDLGLSDIMQNEFPEAGPDTPLHRLYARCAQGLPIAILDDDRRLVGVASPETIFAKLAVDERSSSEIAGPDASENAASDAA